MQLNEMNFDSFVKQTGKTVLVDFWAPWCGPCKLLGPVLDKLAAERTDFVLGKVNTDEESALAIRFGLEAIPTLLFFRDGKLVRKEVGYHSESELATVLEAVKT